MQALCLKAHKPSCWLVPNGEDQFHGEGSMHRLKITRRPTIGSKLGERPISIVSRSNMNLVFSFFVPGPFTTAITATAMSAAIRTYSIAVAPDSSLRNARSRSHRSIPCLRLNGLEEAPTVGRGIPVLSRVRHIQGHPPIIGDGN